MIIKKQSMLSGIEHEMDIPITQAQLDAWRSGELIQNAMPDLSADQREFLMTGITKEEWDATFGEPDPLLEDGDE